MNATIYKSLSNKKEMATVSAGQSVAAAFPGIDFKNAVVVVNGKERTADYVLREFDVVTVRELPAGMTAAIVAFAAVAVGIAVGVYSGIQMYKAKRAAEDAQKELDKVKTQSNKDDIDNRPFLRGASNTVAKDKSQPYICGRHLFTPYLLCSPFYKISGEDGAEEHTYIALECGFNRQVIDSVSIDDVTIKKFVGGEPQEGAYPLDGGNTWTGINFSGANSGNNGFYYNVSSKELRFSTRKKFSLEHYQTLRDNGQKSILLRVRSNGNDDSKIKNDCYVLFYQSRCFDPNKSSAPAGIVRDDSAGLVPCEILEDRERAFCTVMGLRLKSSKNNEDKLKKINVITQGVARTWNGSKWSDARSVTRNSAAWALEILTSGSHPMSRFADAEIDLESFGKFYQWCEANEFYFDYVITQGRKKGDTLNLILDNCGAVMYRDMYGRLAVATDRPQENALAAYNPQNIISISNKKTFGRRTDGLRVKYTTSADGGLRDLSLYSFTIRPVESVTGEVGEELETGADDSGYRTWRIPRIQTAADAGEHLVALRWKLDGEIPYGTVRYDVHLGDELIAENIGGASYDYRFTENLSAEEVGALEFSVKAKGEERVLLQGGVRPAQGRRGSI